MCREARSRLEVLGGAGHLVIPRDQVSEQLGYHPNDFLGRSNAHHLEFRHRGPSPSKGSLPSEPPVPCYKVKQVAIHWATPGTALRTDKQDRRQKRVRQETKPEAT